MSGSGSWSWPRTDLEGLPDFVVAAARAAGEEKGAGGPVVTLSRSLIVPFLQFSPRRDLREKALKAWAARGANGGETDNRAIAAETLALRAERAALLGYEEFRGLQAGNRDGRKRRAGARAALMAVWDPAKARGGCRCRRLRRDDARRWRERAAGAVGLALLRRKAADGRA
jgi:peptidyl-dipeptidase Dcp